jgi:mono/diheme cytochrome c family protein
MGVSLAEAGDVIAYLASATGGTAAAPSTASQAQPAAPLPAGEVTVGRAIFSGERRFANGGAACIACHAAGDLAGGALGPDISSSAAKYGDPGLRTVLASSPFPSMRPIYAEKPLNPEEQAHLQAYLQSVTGQQAPAATSQLPLVVLAGFVAFLILVQVLWLRRLGPVRQSLVRTSGTRRPDPRQG